MCGKCVYQCVWVEVVGRWMVVCGDGGIEGCWYVWCVVVVGVFGAWGVKVGCVKGWKDEVCIRRTQDIDETERRDVHG